MTDETLVIDDDDRYSRFRLIAWWDQQRLRDAQVLVVGAGALGNEVLKNLALLGVGRIYCVDFDTIEESNLTRTVLFRRSDCGRSKVAAAAEALEGMNPDTRMKPLHANIITEVGLGLFRDVDVVIGCLDNREARLWVNRSCWKVGTPWIDGGIQEINGVVKVFVPPDSACYECAMTENDYLLINLRYSCPLLRQEDILSGKVPTAPTISSMVGGLQAQEALKLIHGMPVAAGQALIYNGVANQFYTTNFQRREDCLSHDVYDVPREVPLRSDESTAADLFEAASQWTGSDKLTLELDRDLVVALECPACDAREFVFQPLQSVGMDRSACPKCGELRKPVLEHKIAAGSELAARRLSELGIPPYDIVRVTAGEEVVCLLLAGDRDKSIMTTSGTA